MHFCRGSISFSVQCIDDRDLFVSFSKGGGAMFSSLTVEIEENNHCVSPVGRAEERGGIGEGKLLFLTKCLITCQNILLS